MTGSCLMQAEQSRFYTSPKPVTRLNLLNTRSKYGTAVDMSAFTPPEEERVSRFLLPAIGPIMQVFSKYLTLKRLAREVVLDRIDPEFQKKTEAQKRLLKKARARKDRLSKFHLYNKITNRQSMKIRSHKIR